MGVLSEATYLHMELPLIIEDVEGQLHLVRREGRDSPLAEERLQRCLTLARAMERQLHRFYRREREELFPRAMRIFGGELEEIREMTRYQSAILAALEQFILELSEAMDNGKVHAVHATYLSMLFEEVVDLYEHRCELERNFYESFSSMLFPGGVSTE